MIPTIGPTDVKLRVIYRGTSLMRSSPPPWDHRRAIGMVLLKGSGGVLFLMIPFIGRMDIQFRVIQESPTLQLSYLPAYLRTYLHTYLPLSLPAYLPTCQSTAVWRQANPATSIVNHAQHMRGNPYPTP